MLPFNGLVLSVLCYNIREVNWKFSESANLIIRECLHFGRKLKFPLIAFRNA